MNTKQIIETYGDNQEAVIDQLHNDLKDLIKQRKAYECVEIDSVFKEVNDRYLAVIRKLKVIWDEHLFINSYPVCLQHILKFAKYSKEMSRAIHSGKDTPSIYDYVSEGVSIDKQVNDFLKLQMT